MFDKLLEIGSAFDWISPVAAIIGDTLNGPSHTFLIPIHASPMTGREIARLLSRRGVDSWGHMIVSGTLMISVRQAQAQRAQHLLDQAGVPTETNIGEGEMEQRRPAFDSLGEHGQIGDWMRDLLGG